MLDNAGSKTLQLSILRATVALNATPVKERVKCAVQQGYGELRQLTVLQFGFLEKCVKSPRFPREFWKRLAGADKHHYAYRPFVFGSSVKKPLLGDVWSTQRSKGYLQKETIL